MREDQKNDQKIDLKKLTNIPNELWLVMVILPNFITLALTSTQIDGNTKLGIVLGLIGAMILIVVTYILVKDRDKAREYNLAQTQMQNQVKIAEIQEKGIEVQGKAASDAYGQLAPIIKEMVKNPDGFKDSMKTLMDLVQLQKKGTIPQNPAREATQKE
ncbi:MAG: hypothetical protein RBG13Loki_2703 [Promethearchaeota archaeon CR_4]|nr:MAG: hypothetical protein RBG13Loki_2703 [Candidatus Lokiarchaeota archaeon CR_4]